MAKILNQIVVQENQNNVPKRMIIQWTDDVNGDQGQDIIEYSSLTAGEKADYDAFIVMSENLMNL